MNQSSMSDDFLRDSTRAGLYYLAAEHHQAVARQASRLGFRLLHADLAACRTNAEMLTELGRAFDFPEWYGANFDALFDCLTDPDWKAAPGHVLLILGNVAKGPPSTLLEVLSAAAEERRTAGHPFWILVDTPAHDLPAFPDA